MRKQKVIFLCTQNSARSQMAEGLLRHLAGDRFEVMSAGTEVNRVRPETASAMAEIRADIPGQESKRLDRYLGEPFNYVVTVCDAANEARLFFPGARGRLPWSIEDPARVTGDREERLGTFRSARDQIRARIEKELLAGA